MQCFFFSLHFKLFSDKIGDQAGSKKKVYDIGVWCRYYQLVLIFTKNNVKTFLTIPGLYRIIYCGLYCDWYLIYYQFVQNIKYIFKDGFILLNYCVAVKILLIRGPWKQIFDINITIRWSRLQFDIQLSHICRYWGVVPY